MTDMRAIDSGSATPPERIKSRQPRRPGRALADRLSCGFFPEIAGVKSDATSERYRCHAFEAAALPLHELVHRAPLSAAAIARTEAFGMGNFNAALSAACQRHYPANP